jgi:hypothetical protein
MEPRTAKELGEMILEQMGMPEGVYLTVAPETGAGWGVSVSAVGDPNRAVNYNQMAQNIAAELRNKYSLQS